MKMNRTINFLSGLALVILGIHLMGAHFAKVLPFGIQLDYETSAFGLTIWTIWAYGGWLFGDCAIVGGLFKIFNRQINRYIDTLL